MPEQLPPPNPSEIKSFQSPEESLPWRPVSHESLHKGQQVVIDTRYEACPLEEVGLENTSDYKASVFARVSDSFKGSAEEEENGFDLALVKLKNPSGIDTFHIVTDKIQDDGSVKKNWIELIKDTKFTIGRLDDGTEQYQLDGEAITGKRFSNGISRKHLTIELTDSGLEIKDLSSNGTKIEGVKLIEDQESRFKPQAQEAGAAVLNVSEVQVDKLSEAAEPELIDSVPKTAAEAREANDKRLADSLEELNKPIEEEIALVEAEFNKFLEGFSDKETMSMWKYAAGVMNKKEAQELEDGQGSIVYGQQAGEGLQELGVFNSWNNRREELSKAADKYLNYMQQLKALRSKLKR